MCLKVHDHQPPISINRLSHSRMTLADLLMTEQHRDNGHRASYIEPRRTLASLGEVGTAEISDCFTTDDMKSPTEHVRSFDRFPYLAPRSADLRHLPFDTDVPRTVGGCHAL